MKLLQRHLGVLCLMFAAAAVVAWFMPLGVSSNSVFLAAVIAFIAYLGISYLLPARSPPSETADE
ncbi:MAG: hypothetical protein V4656_02460 [Pseudomonadota bacterium]